MTDLASQQTFKIRRIALSGYCSQKQPWGDTVSNIFHASADQQQEFAQHLLTGAIASPFGSISKGEYDLAIFSALIAAKIIDENEPVFALAQQLKCTPTRINSLLFAYRLRQPAADPDALAKAVRVIDAKKDASGKEVVVLNVESKFWRESLVAKLKATNVYTDTSFNRERLTLPLADFISAFAAVFGTNLGDLQGELNSAMKKNKKLTRLEALKNLLIKAGTSGAAQGAGVLVSTLAAQFAGSP